MDAAKRDKLIAMACGKQLLNEAFEAKTVKGPEQISRERVRNHLRTSSS